MKFLIILCIGLFSFQTIHLSAQHLQVSAELAARLDQERDFSKIMETVDAYYREQNYQSNPKLFSEYKKWNRWAWFAVRHLDESGEVDYKSATYFEEAKRMQQSMRVEGSRSNSGVWNFVGPTTTSWANNVGSKGIGRVDRLAFHPANGNIVIAATPAGGLWRSNDGGLNWYSISSHIPNCGISGIVVSSDDPSGNKIFILTGDADSGIGSYVDNYGYKRTSIGVLVTYDGGVTWNKAGNSGTVLTGLFGYKILQVRGTPSRLIVASNNGIYRSNDFGITWALIEFAGIPIFDLEQHPTNNAILYAALSNTVRKSSDSGLFFNTIPIFSPLPSSCTRSAIAVTADEPNEIYYLQCGQNSTNNRLYKSTDSGENYTSLNNTDLITGQYFYNCAFAINPIDNNFMVAGGINVTSSTNNGNNFGNITVGIVQNVIPPPNYIHSDVHDLAYSPNNNLLYAATDGGVFMSTDDGINWEDRSTGLSCTQYYHMDGFDGTNSLFIGGAQDNGTAFTTNGSHMNYCGTGDGFSVDFVSGNSDIFFMVENTSVNRFTRSTSSRVNVSPGDSTNQTFFPNIITHPTNNNIVYVGYQNSIWRSSDQGGTWTNVPGTGTSNAGSGHTGGFAVTAAFPDRLYAANATTIRRSDNQGNNWTTISGNTGWPATFGVITDMACRNTDPDELWVTMSGNNGQNRVFYSPNAGASWTNFTGTLPNIPVYSITYTDDGDAYIGTELGVFFMDFTMFDWVPFYNGMPMVPVTDVFVNETFGLIQASTFGRGIWESDLYSNCGPALFLSGLTQGSHFYQSNGFIETSQDIPPSFGNIVRLRSPQKIIFKPGCRIGNNAYAHAVIGNCGQGIFNMTGSPDAISPTKSDVLKQMNTFSNGIQEK